MQALLVEAAPDDLLAVGREERAAVVAGHVGQALLVRAVGAHDVDLGEVARVLVERLLLLVVQRAVVGARASTRRRSTGRRASSCLRRRSRARSVSRFSAAGLLAVGVDVHLRVVVPRVAALLARRAERELLVLVLLRLRIGVRRRELDLVAARTEERAGGLADAGRDPLGVAARQIEHVDLIERVARLALALEDQPLAVRRPVAFAGALALDGQAADAGEEIALLIGGRVLLARRGGTRTAGPLTPQRATQHGRSTSGTCEMEEQ